MSIPKIKKASNFRADLFETLKEVSSGEPQVITHNGGDPVVLIAQSEYNALLERYKLLQEISIGAYQLDTGKGLSHEEALKEIEQMKKEWK
jgi:prevent-host-death family protein